MKFQHGITLYLAFLYKNIAGSFGFQCWLEKPGESFGRLQPGTKFEWALVFET